MKQTKPALLFGLLLLSLALPSCGGDDAPKNIVINVDGVEVNDLLVNVAFDTSLVITNDGGTTLAVYDISVSHPANIIIGVVVPFGLDGGESITVPISLILTTSTSLSDTVVITSSDEDFPVLRIPVRLTTRSFSRVQSGWLKFEAGHFSMAATDFQDAMTLDGTYAEAFLGHGWSTLRQELLATARTSLNGAISLGLVEDGNAGKAFAELHTGGHTDAVAAVNAVVTITGPTASPYTFVHDTSITETDLLWVRARAHFLLGQYDQAQIVVDVLVPTNTLDPNSPTYIQELADLIESLRGQV